MKVKFIKPKMVRILNSLSIDTVKIPNKNYAIGKYPITIAEYIHFVKDTNSHYPEWMEDNTKYKDMNLNDNAPIIGVSWYDAMAYCKWLSEKTGKKYRLPRTEGEWVYAVNQDEEGIDSFGNTVSNADDYAWFYDNSGGTTHIVGEKQSYSSLGIYDMYGNVSEWVEESSEDTGRAAVCGGSWVMSKYDWHFDEFEKNLKSNDLGFRIVLEVEKQEAAQKKVKFHTKLEKEIMAPKQLTETLGSDIDFIVGRKTELKSIDLLLKNNNKILITGMRGIGKTTLVSRYLKKVENNYNYLGYIRIEKDYKQSIISAFANALDINESTTDNIYAMVIEKLNRLKGKKLIIIDDIVNIDDKILNEFLDALNVWKIILVAGDVALPNYENMPHFTIDQLSYKEAKVLLRSKVKKDISEDELEIILKSLNYSPLLINKVSALIDNGNVSTGQILNMLRTNKFSGKEQVALNNKITKIYTPANGKVYEFEVNEMYYDIKIHKISEQTTSESQATREMVKQTGATHQGTIKFKDNKQGNIEELNRLIDESFNKEYGLAFYTIIDKDYKAPKKEDYIDFIQAASDMEGWLFENYDEPANLLPHDSRKGGYQYSYGEPYKLDKIVHEEFGDKYPAEYIKRVIEGLEHKFGDIGWIKKHDENENNNESDDSIIDGEEEKSYIEDIGKLMGIDDKLNIYNQYKKNNAIYKEFLEENLESRESMDSLKSLNSMFESQIDGEFNGWEGETIVKLTNGELWQQSEYYYQYMYAYMPKVIVVHSSTGYKMKVDGIDKEIGVVKLNSDISLNDTTSDIIESQIDGDFNGWDGETIFKLMNGQIWQQSKYSYHYHYKFMPKIIIYKTESGYKMKVDGDSETVDVKRIQ